LILFYCVQWEHIQFYFFYLKEKETAKKRGKKKGKEAAVQERTSVQDIAAVQNIYPSTSLPMEHMSEPYMVINTFSQLFTVILQSNAPFF